MVTIPIRFVTCHDAISWTIRGAEMGFWASHAEVIMPDGTYLGAHADGGVEARPAGYDATYKPLELIVHVPATEDQAAACYAFLTSELGKPYDLGAIADLALGAVRPIAGESQEDWRDPAAWFCSELVMAALDHAGLFPNGLPVTPRHITPRDLEFALCGLAKIGVPAPAIRPQAEQMTAKPV